MFAKSMSYLQVFLLLEFYKTLFTQYFTKKSQRMTSKGIVVLKLYRTDELETGIL